MPDFVAMENSVHWAQILSHLLWNNCQYKKKYSKHYSDEKFPAITTSHKEITLISTELTLNPTTSKSSALYKLVMIIVFHGS